MADDSSSDENSIVDGFDGEDSLERDIEEIAEEVERESRQEPYRPETELETEPAEESKPLSKALGDLVEEEGIDIITEVGNLFQDRKQSSQEHEKELIRERMKYNGALLIFFTVVVVFLVYTTTLSPVASLTFIAGLATGFGANTVINS